jgi:lipoprotein NlpI
MSLKHLAFTSLAALTFLSVVACGGGAGTGKPGEVATGGGKPITTTGGAQVSAEAAAGYDKALDAFVAHDRAGDWNEGTCTSLAKAFIDAAEKQQSTMKKPFPEASYNAGLAYARCGKDAEARAQFDAAAKADPGFHRAKAQVVLYDFAKSNDLDGTIRQLDQIIRDAKFQNVEALVSLAALQMERGSDQKDKDGRADFDAAELNLQRALALDDSYMPAFNQLAIYYLERAKAAAEKGEKGKKKSRRSGLFVAGAKKAAVNQQMLDLAALVASQGVRKNPSYAPIHNTAGLIQVQLQNFNSAVKSFGNARRLDPKFFEAHMNYAAVNLSFRGFDEAEKAYRDALKLRPNEFEAYLGLALALRGGITDSNFDKNIAEAKKHLETAKKLEPNRAEPYYNEAILVQEYEAKSASDSNGKIKVWERAAELYRQFIAKAGSDPNFAEAAKRSKDRTDDMKQMIEFEKAGEAERKKMEEEQKNAAAQAGTQPGAAPGAPTDAPPEGGGAAPAPAP